MIVAGFSVIVGLTIAIAAATIAASIADTRASIVAIKLILVI